MAKKNIFDLYNEQNPHAPSTDDTKVARRDEDAEREKVVEKVEEKTEQKAEPADVGEEKKEETKAEPADAGNDDKGGEDNGAV